MKHDFHIDEERKLICCCLEGELEIEESIELSRNLRKKAAELGFNVLYDARKLQEPKSIMPVHDFTKKLSIILDTTIHRIVRIGFLYTPGNHDDYWQFYEDAAVNRGLMIKIFVDKEEAIRWLSN